MQFLRKAIAGAGVLPGAQLPGAKACDRLAVAGMMLRSHWPPMASGTVFVTLEDETGLAPVNVSPDCIVPSAFADALGFF